VYNTNTKEEKSVRWTEVLPTDCEHAIHPVQDILFSCTKHFLPCKMSTMSNNAETTMGQHGFVRVGVAVPTLKVANVEYNTQEIIKQILNADQQGVQILTFPELSLTGYTCGDLFHQDLLLTKSKEGLKTILQATTNDIVSIIGMPLMVDNQLFNVGVVIQTGKILGVVPKTYIPNYNEFYEKRWFASSVNALSHEIDLLGEQVPFGTQILFQDKTDAGLCFGVEICEDARVPISPSAYHTQQGATMTFNLSASNEVVGKDDYRKNLIKMLSAKHLSAYVYASSGMGESTTDMVF
jgi:NAD+ synthase (glutamine-hydrolysing)